MPEPDDHLPDDADPTGIRELLAGLPDPGPMPDDLVRRIEARLEIEQTARAQEAPHSLGRHANRVVDLATERSRRRPGRTLAVLGAVAAGLVATTVVAPQLLGGQDSADVGTAAHYPSRGASDDAGADQDTAQPPAAAQEEEGVADGDAEATMDSASPDRDVTVQDGAGSPSQPLVPLDGELVLLPDLGLLEHDALTQALLLALDESDGGPPAADRPDALTDAEALSCWRDLASVHSFERYVAARAQVLLPEGPRQGEPVVALLGLDEDGAARSWALPQACTHDPSVSPLVEAPSAD